MQILFNFFISIILYLALYQAKRRQQVTKLQLDQWKEAESSTQQALKRAADESARLARRAASVDPGEREREREKE